MPPKSKKKCKTRLNSKEYAIDDTEVKFYKNPVTIKQRMENARSMELINANYEDDIFDHINNNNNSKNMKGTNYFKFDLSSSSLDTLEEGDCSSHSSSSPFVVPRPLRSSACQSETPAKFKKQNNNQVSPIKR